jgi:hypothetical protein
MSYESINKLHKKTKIRDVIELIELLGFQRVLRSRTHSKEELAEYYWFEETEYRSYSGVSLSLAKDIDGQLIIYTRTVASRSYYDLDYQNRIIRTLKRHFGGAFETDLGKGRYFPMEGNPPVPAQAGCHLAFQRFGQNLIKADIYLECRKFVQEQWKHIGKLEWLNQMNPRLLSNNLLLPYLISIIEDYFKSTFIALFKYSNRKETFLKGTRLASEHLSKVSSGECSIEEVIAETLPFQKILAICQHFKVLEPNLDLAGILRKPYRKRKKSLLESLEELVLQRHRFIHRGILDTSFDDRDAKMSLNDIETSVVRCYQRITDYYGWEFDKGWGRGRK